MGAHIMALKNISAKPYNDTGPLEECKRQMYNDYIFY